MDERRAPAGGAAVVERDRVLDAARAFALLVVVVAHSLAWDLSTTSPMSVLDLHPGAAGWTWSLQILPLFFAAGAVTNLGSWQRRPDGFLSRRLVRLGVPALVYTAFWTAIGLPAALLVPGADLVGRFLAQLLWFLGVYAAVTAAVPWTVRWTARPVLSLGVWLAVIAVVDALRWNVHPTLGQLNLLFVWGFLHQVGLHLPALRRARPAVLLAGAASAVASAVGLAVLGPYSSSLVTYAADPEPSNLSPPTLVVALYGLGLVLVLAALWRPLTAVLSHHEYLDGSGYPRGLRADEVSDLVRMITICDVYAALIERRSYKAPMAPEQAYGTLAAMTGKLDPDLLRAFRQVILPN